MFTQLTAENLLFPSFTCGRVILYKQHLGTEQNMNLKIETPVDEESKTSKDVALLKTNQFF